ncbi:MAG: amidohydrolase family protein [Myxococcota bacterium]|nr:amidohydrolase family protein [Myxococcales bacterium]
MADLRILNATLVDGTGAPERMADVRVEGGRIAEIAPAGALGTGAGRAIDAQGRLLTPGFVDPHTHYDGQVTWDPVLAPSSWHGVTTVVMGNCGVGFAPARASERAWLVELMEGVEDIPGTALHDGIQWAWETFPEYLDALERMPRTIDVATQIPHGALRVYAMGERGAAQERATADELEKMAALVREGIRAGALAFSTNRLPLHTSIHGDPVPGTFADRDELLALARAVVDGGGRIVQSVPAGSMGDDPDGPVREVELYREISRATGATVTFSTVQVHPNPELWREVLKRVAAANASGAKLVPQVLARPAGLLASFDTFNPFAERPSYQEVAALPLAERVKRLRDPARRARLLSDEEARRDNAGMGIMRHSLRSAFAMDAGVVFEPEPSQSIAARAEREGVDPVAKLFDVMCDLAEASTGGRTRMLHVYFSGYAHGSLDAIGEMLASDLTVAGLADGGAHCSMICDASMPTFVLAHWVRDRTRGPRIPLPQAVRMLSKEPADLYGLRDRGVVAVGRRADLNLIDLDRIELDLPEITPDLPTGAARVLQRGHGYDYTIVAGEVTFEGGEPTGARPGGLVRGERAA